MAENSTQLSLMQVGNRGIQIRDIQELSRFAKGVVDARLAPKTLSTPQQIIVATQYGMELGLTPMVALNSIAVIGGKPTIYGDIALALVRRSGLLETISEEVETDKDDKPLAAICRTKRLGDKAAKETKFTVQDAIQAKLWNKQGPWQTHPKRMLKYKARAFNLRDQFPDVLMGAHLYEEMQGEEYPEEPQCNTPPRRERRKAVENTPVPAPPEDLGSPEGGLSRAAGEGEPAASLYDLVLKRIAQELEQRNFVDIEPEDALQQFAVFALMVDEDEADSPEKFTDQMLDKLNSELDKSGLPEELFSCGGDE